jgi:Zn-dependent protease
MFVVVGVLILWIMSLCLHEYGHARVAYAGGDTTVEEKGYLSLNPLRYMNPMMSIIIPVIILMLGAIPLPGGAVYINTSLLRNRHWSAAMSAAGPLANLLLLFLVGLIIKAGVLPAGESDLPTSLDQTLALFGYFMAFAFVVNMLPVPGLDGFGILEPYLPKSAQQFARSLGFMGIFLVVIVLFQVPEARSALVSITERFAYQWAGIPPRDVFAGLHSFRAALGR